MSELNGEQYDDVGSTGEPAVETAKDRAEDGSAGGPLASSSEKAHDLAGIEFTDPTEVLLELARRGELDPWDIDIAKITAQFLKYVDSLERQDLRIPARTLLYASILLRMKSDAMEEPDEQEDEAEEPLEEPAPQEDSYQLPRPPVRRRTKRPVTLDELISELKKAEMVGRRRAVRVSWPQPSEDEILDLSHEEGIEDRIRMLAPVVDDLLGAHERVGFVELQGDRVMNYISLLFMSHRKEIWLEQEEMWGELYLKKYPEDGGFAEMEGAEDSILPPTS